MFLFHYNWFAAKKIQLLIFSGLFSLPMTVLGGTIAFEAPVAYPAASAVNPGPESVEIGDLNRDGHLDLLTADNGFASIWYGDGAGNFPATRILATKVGNTTATVDLDENEYAIPVDINQDGYQDVVVANAPNPNDNVGNSLLMYLNNPSSPGLFETSPQSLTEGIGVVPTSVRQGSMNQGTDGLLDLIAGFFLDPRVLIYRNNGMGGFSPAYQNNLLAQSAVEAVVVGDLNQDGYYDIVLVDRLRVWWFLGDGSGGYPTIRSLSTGSSGEHLEYDVRMADVDQNGWPDLVVGNGGIFDNLNATSRSVVVVWDPGLAGVDGIPEMTALDAGSEVSAVGMVDFDGDGHLDLMAACPHYFTEGSVRIFQNDGTTGRVFSSSVLLENCGRGMLSVAADDLNQNGRIDLVVASEGLFSTTTIPGKVQIYRSSGSTLPTATPSQTPTLVSTFTPTPTVSPTGTRTATPTRSATRTPTETAGPTVSSDINRDGSIDEKDLLILMEQQGNLIPPNGK